MELVAGELYRIVADSGHAIFEYKILPEKIGNIPKCTFADDYPESYTEMIGMFIGGGMYSIYKTEADKPDTVLFLYKNKIVGVAVSFTMNDMKIVDGITIEKVL